ncbi:MAG TPA: hypothetical protein VJV39_06180 [Dongiaceae bacterium]|nr:hypothetical protein [Dongiaceae bacterium]
MNEQLKALVDVRDRFVTRFADYDLKALTLLFGIAAAWGVIKGSALPAGPMIAVFLAFAGLFVSVGWVVQRRLLWRIDDSYADAIKAMAKADARDPALDRTASFRARLQYGEPLSVVIFALLTGIAIWSYQSPNLLFAPDAPASPEDTADLADGPDLIRAIPLGDSGQVVLVSPYNMEVVALTDSSDVECPCDREYGVTSGPASYGASHYASMAGHRPFDPRRQLTDF